MGMNGERIWMDLNVLRYTLVDPHHYHHSLPWNPMNLTEVTIHKYISSSTVSVPQSCGKSPWSLVTFKLFFRVEEFPLHPLLPTNTNMAGWHGFIQKLFLKLFRLITFKFNTKSKAYQIPITKILLRS